MNKISKKIVALVTMAAFVLTLAPVAAFAAANVDPTESSYTVDSTTTPGTITVTMDLNEDGGSDDINAAKVRIVLTDTQGNEVTNAGIKATSTNGGLTGTTHTNVTTLAGSGASVTADSTGAGAVYTFSDVPTGTYKLQVSVDPANGTDFAPIYPTANTPSSAVEIPVADAAVATNSALVNKDGGNTLTVKAGDSAQLTFLVKDQYGNITNEKLGNAGTSNVYVWAEKEKDTLDQYGVVFTAGTDANAKAYIGQSNNNDAIWFISENNGTTAANVKNGNTITANFMLPGTYTIYAGVAGNSVQAGTDAKTALKQAPSLLTPITVTVEPGDDVTEYFAFNNDNGANPDGTVAPVTDETNAYTYTINDQVTPNGVKVYTVTGYAKDAAKNPAAYELINLSANKSGIQLLDSQVGTDANGKFTFKFTLTKNGTYDITLTEANGDATGTLTVVQEKVTPSNIETIKDGGYVLAGNDTKYSTDYTSTSYFADAVQFKVTDAAGQAVEAAALTKGANANDYTLTVSGPEASKLEAADLTVVWDPNKEVYTLKYSGDNKAKDLVPGEYTVKVAFNNSSKSATATFNVAKFGEAQELAIDFDGNVTDKVTLAQTVNGTVKLVDANGLKVDADSDVAISINGAALKANSASVTTNTTPKFSFKLPVYSVDNEAFYGTTVTVTAFDKDIPDTKTATLTVVADETNYDLAFDSTQGVVDTDNEVGVSVVDVDGNVVKDVDGSNTTLYAYLVSQSNENAKVNVAVDTDNMKDGKGTLTVYADQATDVEIAVVVYDERNKGNAIYAGNLKYTVGEKDANADTTVVMTIGSSDLVVNNKLVAGDAAPYVADSRTMVPIRVLTESFGAEVDFKDNVVTIVDGDTTIVMTIGETAYTVNDAKASMDVAPVIGSGDRTYVPVRFVAEALGYEVTPLYAADGTTASVLFQK